MVAEIVRCAVVWLAFPGGRVLFFVKLRARRKEGPAGSIKEQNSPPGNANHTTRWLFTGEEVFLLTIHKSFCNLSRKRTGFQRLFPR